VSVLAEIGARAAADSPLWASSLRAGDPPDPRFAGSCPEPYLLGVEMIYEAYLLHYGGSRLFRQDESDLSLLTGDYLYAAGLAEICRTGDLAAVAALADLISRCARNRGDGQDGADEALWRSTVASLGRSG
jgi:hypothetical protein